MLILVRHAPPFRRWHRRLGERLEATGHRVRFEAIGASAGRLHLALERRLYRVVPDWLATETLPAAESWAPELTVVLAGPLPETGLVVRPDYAGGTGEGALLAAARYGIAPVVAVRGGAPDALRLLARGQPAIEDACVSARAMEDLLPRVVTLLVRAVARSGDGEEELPPAPDEAAPSRRVSAAATLARGLAHKLVRRLGPARGRPEHWRLALRREGEPAYTPLADDPSCFRADPFLFAEAGRLWLFTEDYPYATGKGVIACQEVSMTDQRAPASDERFPFPLRERVTGGGHAVRFVPPVKREARNHAAYLVADERGGTPTPSPSPQGGGDVASGFAMRDGPSRTVLEEPFHLSYPLVLRHRGAIYMLPETSAAARVRLYRADPFPDRWVPDTVLIDGRRLADATPVFHEGRWWLFATSDEDGGSSWDQLLLFHAPDLFGPWTAHAGNPVLIDAGAARPAGLMWHDDGALMRPSQDCRAGYGAGLAICRVDRLDEGGYRQSVVRRVAPPPGFRATGLHTLNRAEGWEVVDLKVPHPR